MRIVRPDGSVIEGTPSEIAEFEQLQVFKSSAKSMDASAPTRESTAQTTLNIEGEEFDYATTDVAFRCLTRLKLSKPLKAAIRMIYAAETGWTTAAEIQEKIGYNSSQFGGMMGAFGRRFVNTPGYVLNSSFFEYEWDDSLRCYKYRLPPAVRTAVVQARIVN